MERSGTVRLETEWKREVNGKEDRRGQSGWRAKVVENSKRNDDIERAFGGEAEREREK